ncbi:hypothetical protein HN51_061444 [Arachis hypogaea]
MSQRITYKDAVVERRQSGHDGKGLEGGEWAVVALVPSAIGIKGGKQAVVALIPSVTAIEGGSGEMVRTDSKKEGLHVDARW